jgi:DNA polymerase-3 subunit gamma/tau
MKFIAAQEDIDASDEVLSVVAQAGEGSVRDSLSALDQAIACCGKTLRVEDIRVLLGMFGTESLRAVAEAVHAEDGARMLDIVQELERNGQSLQHFARELSRYWRNLLVAKISGKPTRLIPASDAEQQSLLEVAGWFTEEDLTRYLNLTLDLYKTLQESLQPRLHMELGLIKLVQVGKLQPIEEALAALGQSDSKQGIVSQPPAPQITASTRTATPRPPAFQVSTRPALAPPSTPSSASQAGDFRQALYDALCKAGLNFTADAVQRSEVSLQGTDVVIRAPKTMLLALKDPSLQRIASELVAKPVRVRVEAGENLSTAPVVASSADSASDASLRERALSHPGVKRFQELFPDAQVRTVRNLNE